MLLSDDVNVDTADENAYDIPEFEAPVLLLEDVGTADKNACEDTCMLTYSTADVDAHLTRDDAPSIISSAESPVAPSFSSISGMCINL